MKNEISKSAAPIVFCTGEETKPVILGKDNYKQSLFASQIDSAIELIHDKTVAAKKLEEEQTRLQPEKKELHFNDVYDNNIISFVGERGSGKSSCMYSVLNVLMEEDRDDNKYCFLGAIDPSFFDANHNILQLIIGKMYASFCRETKKRRYMQDEDENIGYGDVRNSGVHSLKTAFQLTKRHLKYLDAKPQYEYDDELEELNQLSAGIDLRDSLLELVTEYLKFIDRKMLVITIDDIDLNTEQAYEMAEQIRRFLILPNVIILMAVKLDQLLEVIRLKLTEQYKTLLSDNRMGSERITEMATRYITKFMPLESRIYMPDLDVYMNTPLEIVADDRKVLAKFDSIKIAVPELIFKKCRYLFYNSRGTTSPVVPRNLRELRMLLGMLFQMSDYSNDSSNKTVFKKYFFESWLNNLGNKSQAIARELIDVNEPTQLNKSVVQALKKRYDLKEDVDNGVRGWNIILGDNAVNYNLSTGDAFAVMDYVKRVNADTDTQRLIFFIKSLYSIRLYEYYDRQTDAIDAPSETKERSNEPNRHDDFLENISDYRKLIGGSFFNAGRNTLLPQDGREDEDKANSREVFMINKNPLTNLINKIKNEYDDIKNKPEEDISEFTDNLMTAEFLMLSISRHLPKVNSQSEASSGVYRSRIEPYYERNLEKVQNVVFDIMTPFFTLTDVSHAYGRFDSDIFSIARGWDVQVPKGDGTIKEYKSLYNKMMALSNNDGEHGSEHNFLSRAGIRNAEVSDDLLQHLKSARDKYRPGSRGLIGILAEFYKNIAEYCIATYDKWTESDGDSAKEKYYEIRFLPFKAIENFLGSTSNSVLTEVLTARGNVKDSVMFNYIDRDMKRDEIWSVLSEQIPELKDEHKTKLFHGTFKVDNKPYSAYLIRERLQNLSGRGIWTILKSQPEEAEPFGDSRAEEKVKVNTAAAEA